MKLDLSNTKKIIFIVFCGALFLSLFQNFNGVLGLVSKIFSYFSPIIAALCIAFVLNVMLNPIENKLLKFMGESNKKFIRKLKRPLGIAITYLLTAGILSIIVLVIVPQIIDTIIELAEKLPSFIVGSRKWIETELHKFNINSSLPEIKINWTAASEKLISALKGSSPKIFQGAVGVTTSLIGGVFDTVFGIILSIYILSGKEKIGNFIKNLMEVSIPEKATKNVIHIANKTSECFSRFIGGQCAEALILGSLCFVGMLIFKIPNALIVSVLVTVTALIPIVGATFGVVVGALIILITNPIKAFLFVIFFLILQQIEGNLIYPKVVGKAVGIPGVIVVSSVLVGGNIGGVLGALISVPTAATIYTLVKEAVENRKKNLQQKL